MKKSIFAICDLESSYACNLMDYLNEKKTTPFEVQAFTSLESLIDFVKDNPLEILLISTRAMCNEIKELPIKRIIILSEGEKLQNLDEYPFVYKYQSSDSLVAEVMEHYAVGNPQLHLMTSPLKKTQIYGIYSPIGRTGKTSFALTLGEILAEKKQVLYINLEGFSGFEELFGKIYRTDLSDLIYFARQKEGNLIYRLNTVIQNYHELSYIPPALSPIDIRDVTGEEWLSFLQEIIAYCEYDVILLDLNEHVDELFQILQRCDRIYMPVKSDIFSSAKIKQFEKLLQMLDYEKVRTKIRKIELPNQILTQEGQDMIQQLIWGEMGKFVRMLLWEDDEQDG